jgi:hypothetical protein
MNLALWLVAVASVLAFFWWEIRHAANGDDQP